MPPSGWPGCGSSRTVSDPTFTPPNRPGMVRFIDGQLCEWDDEPPEMFGQIWVPVCIWCRNGPLDQGRLACDVCPNGNWSIGRFVLELAQYAYTLSSPPPSDLVVVKDDDE